MIIITIPVGKVLQTSAQVFTAGETGFIGDDGRLTSTPNGLPAFSAVEGSEYLIGGAPTPFPSAVYVSPAGVITTTPNGPVIDVMTLVFPPLAPPYPKTGVSAVRPSGTRVFAGKNSAQFIYDVSFNATCMMKIEAESTFKRARIKIYNPNASEAEVKFSIAPTNERDNSTDENRFRPLCDYGVPNDASWRYGTLKAQRIGVMPVGSEDFTSVLVSDWADVETVPAKDGGRPLVLLRVYLEGAVNEFSVVSGVAVEQWRGAEDQLFYRQNNSVFDTNQDRTDDAAYPTGKPFSGGIPIVVVEFDYNVEVTSCYACGDSITAGGTTPLAYAFDTWHLRAALSKSTQERPYSSFNGGYSGFTVDKYLQQFEKDINAGLRPSVVTVPAASPNDEATSYADMLEGFTSIVSLAEEVEARVFVWTALPVDDWSEAQQANLQAMNTYVRENAEAEGWILMDFNRELGDTATPQRFLPGKTEDGTHPSVEGSQDMSDIFRAALDNE